MRRALKAISIVIRILLIGSILAGCCHPNSCVLEPNIVFVPQKCMVNRLPSAFPFLTPEEKREDWGKELQIGTTFAKEFDLYRAITAFKRAEILIPCGNEDRKKQIQYLIILSYYLGNKHSDVIETFEASLLRTAGPNFPAFHDLILILEESYRKEGICDKANSVLQLIQQHSQEVADELALSQQILEGDLVAMQSSPIGEAIGVEYGTRALSVRKAQTLNAVLPGAGYYYVGQTKAAMTSFIINTLFIAAAYQLYSRGYIAGGIILTSLEMGWYLGGINGAGLAAKEYNEQLYNTLAKEAMVSNRLFPILTFEYAF
jgi:hypothetical protein